MSTLKISCQLFHEQKWVDEELHKTPVGTGKLLENKGEEGSFMGAGKEGGRGLAVANEKSVGVNWEFEA